MKKKIIRVLSTLVSGIKKTDYEVVLWAKSKQFPSWLDITGFDAEDEEIKSFLKEMTSIEARFIKKNKETILLSFVAEEREEHKNIASSIIKSDDVESVYENYLANITPIAREYDWWATFNEFANAVEYALKMKDGMKEIAGIQIA